MVDHREMRDAMNRALEEIHNKYCNFCKDPFIQDSGTYTKLTTSSKTYQIWYCDNCSKKQEEQND
jgi:RNase P subunit RPR2